jgi:D-alanyl-D-alanine carboxypeptidase
MTPIRTELLSNVKMCGRRIETERFSFVIPADQGRIGRVTVPDPHAWRAPFSRPPLRDAHQPAAARRAAGADESVSTQPISVVGEAAHAGDTEPSHPPIFKPPPPPLRPRVPRVAVAAPLIAQGRDVAASHARRRHLALGQRHLGARITLAAASVVALAAGTTGIAIALTPPVAAPRAVVTTDVITGSQADPTGEATDAATHSPATTETLAAGDVDRQRAAPASLPLCASPGFTAALARHDDTAAIEAAGGGAAFRDAVVSGQAPCVQLADPTRLWMVVDKRRPFQPIHYAPAPLTPAAGVHSIEGDLLRHDAADALSRMAAAAAKAGVGEIALQSGYRSFATQQRSHAYQVDLRGMAKADLVSARPGYSEHQSGLTGDLVACTAGRCGSLDDFAGSAQGRWIAAHAWEYGWIVRYEPGRTGATGYLSEPWHLRYIGTELATAYRTGGFHTLEEFFGLPDAPDYHR